MDTIQSDEALRVWIITHLCDKLGDHAILKGGMVLRLLDCPRYTNDLDYVFIPYKSKKDILPLILETLKSLKGTTVQHRVHSTNAQFDVNLKNDFGTFKTQIEANVAEDCASQVISTQDLASHYAQMPRAIRVMRFDIMLAHKLAAWNERRLMRDLYDAYFMCKYMTDLPNLDVLRRRLEAVRYAKRVSGKSLPKKMSLDEFCSVMESELKSVTAADFETELRDYLDAGQLAGLETKVRITLTQMCERIRLQ